MTDQWGNWIVDVFVDRNVLEESQKTWRIKKYTKVNPNDVICEIRTIRYAELMMEFNFSIFELARSFKIGSLGWIFGHQNKTQV